MLSVFVFLCLFYLFCRGFWSDILAVFIVVFSNDWFCTCICIFVNLLLLFDALLGVGVTSNLHYLYVTLFWHFCICFDCFWFAILWYCFTCFVGVWSVTWAWLCLSLFCLLYLLYSSGRMCWWVGYIFWEFLGRVGSFWHMCMSHAFLQLICFWCVCISCSYTCSNTY